MTTSTNGSSVHEAFSLMATLLAPRVPVRFLELSGQLLQRRQMEEVFEERAVQKCCAFPACNNPLSASSGKFRVSLARKEIYEPQYERQFCSQLCLKKARVLLSRLAHKPPQLVPSLLEVFGTDKPNPSDYEDEEPAKRTETAALQEVRPPPQAKTVWAKTTDLSVVERKHSSANPMSVAVPPALEAATSSTLKENEAPAAPDRNFPTAEHAVLIEGYVFPSHKQQLAKKVEKMVKKSQEEGQEGDNLVVSDSDESDAAGSEASSAGSFEISDFDDEEVVTLDDLPLFSHLWGLFSGWITHKTTLMVAGLPLPEQQEEKTEVDEMNGGPSKAEIEAAHNIKAEDLQENERSNQVKTLTKLDTAELQQLLNLFYEVRKDSDVVIDTDVDAAPTDSELVGNDAIKQASAGGQPSLCRKCRRSKIKCVCHNRSAARKEEKFSTSQLEAMMQQALDLREEYDELLQPDD
ncbi:hypothetical protein PHYBOEH_007164 [Phytophthora boehmeriae]|uniref:RNA polymerase II subunit B1 CTD phosphatase RPAP2 homolog n=1 Tax=Phytophthora boehmeriae TaxID=109152 RepID=A0A8T1W7Y3_9STRA|nr:hypothetical protein PHYBOEH_007164 [Phytophthora boehmeriae]